MVDSYEDQLANSATRLERSRLKYERLSKVIISMKAGVGHLQDKLESFREEIRGKFYTIGDETVADVLRECEVCFNTLVKRIKAGEDEAKRTHITELAGGGAANNTRPMSLSRGEFGGQGHHRGGHHSHNSSEMEETASKMNTLRPFNQRIDLSLTEDSLFLAGGAYGDGEDGMAGGDMDDDELTRDKVKRASSQILMAMDKKKKKPKKKGPGGGSGGGGGGGYGNDDDHSLNSARHK
jgi:hypothetical protein